MAATAWCSFAATAADALRGAGGGPLPEARLSAELAGSLDAVAAQGLAPLVPAQLLAAARAALQARLAHLRGALDRVFADAKAMGTWDEDAAEVEEAEEEEGSWRDEALADMEATLADTLRVRAGARSLRAGCACLATSPACISPAPCTPFCSSDQLSAPLHHPTPPTGHVRRRGVGHAAAVPAVRARAARPAGAGLRRPRRAAVGGAPLPAGGRRRHPGRAGGGLGRCAGLLSKAC